MHCAAMMMVLMVLAGAAMAQGAPTTTLPATVTTTTLLPQKSFLDEPAQPTDAPEVPSLATTLTKLVVAMLLILALLAGALMIFRRISQRGGLKLAGGGNRALRVVERISLGPKQGIVLINANGRQLVVGMTEHEMTVLTEFETGQEGEGSFDQTLTATEGRPSAPKT